MSIEGKGRFRDFHQFDISMSGEIGDEDYCIAKDEKESDLWVPFLSFPITQSCNFRCVYCGIGGEATASDISMISPEQIRETVTLAANKGIRKFRVTGGEPFIHNDIDEILTIFNEMGYFTLINTNGSLLTKHESLLRTLRNSLRFAVSLDTLVPAILKEISNVDCLGQTISGIRLLNELGLLMRINTVVTKMNYRELPDIIAFCQELGCDLKLLDIVSVPVPFGNRGSIYQEISSLEAEMAKKCDEILSHEYTRGFGTPCRRYRFGKTCVTIKNSVKGSHYDRDGEDAICKDCPYFPCHEGLYDLFALADGRICSCRWTERQISDDPSQQMDYLIKAFRRSMYIRKHSNVDMDTRMELKNKHQ